jgi:hypothetical protein
MVDYRTWGVPQPNSASRSAAIWQIILGGFLFLCGSCVGSLVWILPDDLMNQVVSQQAPNIAPMPNMTLVQEVRFLVTIGSGIMFLAGLLLLIFAWFVYRGGKVSTICSMLITIMVGCFFVLNFVSSIPEVASHPTNILPMLVLLGMVAVAGITIARLIAVLRSAGASQAQAMQQAYYWMMQYQQQYAAQNQAGYGYAPPPGSASIQPRQVPVQSPQMPAQPPPAPPPPGDAG